MGNAEMIFFVLNSQVKPKQQFISNDCEILHIKGKVRYNQKAMANAKFSL